MGLFDFLLAIAPLVPSIVCILFLQDRHALLTLVSAVLITALGFFATDKLIPVFAEYTLKKGLSGKDLGKKGTENESKDIPESLGIVCGIVFLVCTILSQIFVAETPRQMVIFNAALFSICFMILLGFMDDVVDLKWRYKLILPTIASLPLLMSYSGSTAMYLPRPFASFLMQDGHLTLMGRLFNITFTVDSESNGKIVELGWWFMLFMGLQAVFCTNAINILAGINGIECGQSYVIAASLLFFKLFEIVRSGQAGENELFACLLILPFIGTALGILRHNWFPARVFVGDTFCYFSGMTFAVIGIHSHFSKTLLLLFIPQVFNFLYSIPQLFKIIPCPRHRLPTVDAQTRLLHYSRFPCGVHEYRWFKVHFSDETCPNYTVLNAILRILGPMHEKTLCIVFLCIQVLCSMVAFYLRYYLLES
jgi:UDP-N-acetylglucosamine--dolichyl-phosphate N-acetylglucosaminephosphotransferase